MNAPFVLVTDVPSVSSSVAGGGAAVGRVRLSAQGFSFPTASRFNFCFAGRDEDLVVSASGDNNLYVWSLRDSQENAISVNQYYSSCVDTHRQSTPSDTTPATMSLLLPV